MRARLQINGSRVTLGEFQSAAEVEAAKTGGLKMVNHLEVKKSKRQQQNRPTLPSLETIARLAEMGTFDRQTDALIAVAQALVERHRMVQEQCRQATPAGGVLSLDEIEAISGQSTVT
jgi:hypothetical protein